MSTTNFYCRGSRCRQMRPHNIEGTTNENPGHDYTKLKCVKCEEPPFVVEHEKGKPVSITSRRVNDMIPEPEE